MSFQVAIMMGSKSDLGVLKPAAKVLQEVAGVERQRRSDRESEAEEEHAAMVLSGRLPGVGAMLGCC